MSTKKRSPLSLFIIVAGTVLIFQLIPSLGFARPVEFGEIGVLSKEMVLAAIVVVIGLSSFLVLLNLLSLLPGPMPNLDLSRFHLIPLVAGAELVVFGLASVNLSGYVVNGTTASILPIGIELFSVGMISIALFVTSTGRSCVIKSLPNYSFILFFLSLLPASLLITI